MQLDVNEKGTKVQVAQNLLKYKYNLIQAAKKRNGASLPNLIDETEITVNTTQKRRTSGEEWYKPPPTPHMQGPPMYQQLQMGQIHLQSRVQIRAPPPSRNWHFGHFNLESHATLRDDTIRKTVIDMMLRSS